MDHTPFDYRPEGEPRVIVPADVCDTCSDFTSDPIKLVPASFCPYAREKLTDMYWWERRTRDALDEHGGDA